MNIKCLECIPTSGFHKFWTIFYPVVGAFHDFLRVENKLINDQVQVIHKIYEGHKNKIKNFFYFQDNAA